MCGIAGFFDLTSRSLRADAQAILRNQVDTFRYRGPDASGVFAGPGVGLAHVRLSIIDISPASNQPFFDDTGTVAVVFNGEIYNFHDLRSSLIARGRRFRTQSDTEVLAEGFAEWGDAIVDRLRGMFSIAIYDSSSDRLLLVRDRVGKKPLYYTFVGDTLVFASEIKGILAFPNVRAQPDLGAIHDYLTFQYVPSPHTAFSGIYKMPPGHLMTVTRHARPKPHAYYSFPPPGRTLPVSTTDATEQVIEQLREATRLRLIADVPLGAFLSGGVDSSSVVAMMASLSNSAVNTFTIGFDEHAYDERRYARMVAARYGTNHREFTVRPDAVGILPHLIYHYGEPFADSSAIPTYYVSQIAREHVTVILSGDGADESFFGYSRYNLCREKDVPGMRRSGRSRLYEQSIAYFSDAAKNELYSGDFRQLLKRSSLDLIEPYFATADTLASGAAWADIHTYLPDDLLVKVDVASMAHSLEVRSPFLDHKLMEWAASVPEDQRFAIGETKSLLKSAMRGFLPDELLYRPKMGFGVPIEHWLRREMREFTRDILLSDRARARGIFNPDAIQSLLDRHNLGENWAIRIWALLMLELWFEMWIDHSPPTTPPSKLGLNAVC